MKWKEETPWFILSSVATLIAALATVMIANSTRKQVYLANDALEESKKVSKATQATLEESIKATKADVRAYVTVSSIKIDPLKAKNRLTISITNSGRTPALNVRFSMKTKTQERQCDPPDLDHDAMAKGTAVIAAGQTYPAISHFTIGPGLGEKILRGEKWIVTQCEISYKDIFGFSHETKILGFYNSEAKAYQWCPEGTLSI